MKKTSQGFSLIELLIVVAIILIIASIAIPNLLRTKMQAQKAAAVSTIRNLHNSQAVYVLQYGGGQNYAGSLAALGPGTPCSAAAACLVDLFIGCAAEPCKKGGYAYFLVSPGLGSYTSAATPLVWGNTGDANYCDTEAGTIGSQVGASASLAAPPTHVNCQNEAIYAPI